MITLRITNVWLFVEGPLSPEIRQQIRDKMSYVVPNFKHMTRYKQMVAKSDALGTEVEWDGRKTVALIKGSGLRCPTGLASYLKEVLTENNVPYKVEDERQKAFVTPGWTAEGLDLRDYQLNDIVLPGIKQQRGVMWAATGAGKTRCMADMIVRVSAFPAVFYVPSCDLLRQTYECFKRHIRYNGNPTPIGRVGGGYCDIHPITIATVQSCQRALEGKFTKFDDETEDDETSLSETQKAQVTEMVREAQFVSIDECQHTSSDTIQTVLNNSHKARYRIGCSASPWRDDGLDILIEACFGRRFCKVDASFLIKRGYLVKPQITFHHFQQYLGKCANFNALYTRFVSENETRNKWIAERAQFHMERGRPTIILVKWSKHAELLKELIPQAEVLTSSGEHKKTAKKREEILNLMRERKIMCIIGTSLLDEGVDVPSAGAGIFAGGGKSSTRALQRIGRLIRLDPNDPAKDMAYIDEIHDHCKWLDHHAKMRRRIYATEREFEVMDNRNTMTL